MPTFAEIQQDVEGRGVSVEHAICLLTHLNFRVDEVVQDPPWTFVRLHVVFDGVRFEGRGHSRQRQYTSLVITRRHGFPWVRVVLARKDKWDADYGQLVAGLRAINCVVKNAVAAYLRWEKGSLVLPNRNREEVS